MNKNKSLLFLCLITSGLTLNSVLVSAEEIATTSETSQPENSEADELNPMFPPSHISKPILSEVELGMGYISDDSWKFGRYNDMNDEGAYVVGNINISEFWDGVYFLNVRGKDLGLDSRYLRVEGGKQGSYEVFLEYDRIPNNKSNTVKTPFYGIGSNNLTLPAGFDITNNLDANLREFDLKTRRERFATGLEFVPTQRWQFDIDFSHENKKGVDAIGAAIGGDPVLGSTIRYTTTALIPEPIDYDTDKVNASVSYVGEEGHFDLTYHLSLFDNDNDNLSWQNPFYDATNSPTTAGNMSLAPDNEFHQLSLSGAYNLPYKSRISGLISSGRMTQDDDFQPYSVNSGAPAHNSLDGEVWVTNARLKVTSRPIHKLRLNAEYQYNERDNDTPVETYNYTLLDSTSTATATNRPYSYENERINLDANYRFNSKFSVHGGYKYNEMERSYTGDEEREETEEDTFFAKWKIKAHEKVDLSLFTEYSTRDGSTYNPPANENPAMRKYFLADRDRNKYGTSIDYMATDRLLLSARAEYSKDDYDDTSIGLTEEEQPLYNLDFSYQLNDHLTIYGYYTYEQIQSSQANLDISSSPVSSTPNWEADYEDTFNTYGIGFKWSDIDKLEFGGDLLYAKSDGEVDMKDLINPGTEDQYPDTETERKSIKLWANYQYNKNLSYKLTYWYEDYDTDNWAIDDVPAYVDGALLLDGDNPDYDVNVITLSATYRF